MSFRRHASVLAYANHRYQTRLQRIVDLREQATLQLLLERHVGRGNFQALDVPCGYGRLTPLLRSLGYTVQSADISPAMVDYVLSRPESGPNAHVMVADIANLPLDNGAVDLVVTVRLLQHFSQAQRRIDALREIARVTRRWAVVSFYDRRSLHWLTKGLGRRLQNRPLRTWMLTRENFGAEAKQAGLAVRAYAAWQRGLHAHTFALLELQAAGRAP